ncbi:MAG: leucine-rich repeat protein [Oscillospiraceae bacterium]
MLLATPAAADTPIAVPTDKLFFDKANGVITGIDADWLAKNKDKPLSVTIPAEINGTPVTSIGQNAFNGKKVVAVDFSNATNLEKIDNQAFMHSPVASVDLSNTQVTVIGKFAFGDCKSLETFIFSNTLTSLGNSDGASVFTDCRSLKVMRLAGSPEGVVFELPEGLTTIGYQCFKNCFADGVDAKVIIPASVATLGEGAFYDEHITQIIFEKTVDPWKNEDYSGYANSAITPPSDCDRIIVLPDNKCFAAYSTQVGYGSKLQKICTYPIKITFSPLGKQEQHLNHALLGWTYNPATKLWDFNNNYKLPDTNGATSGNERPGYEYVGGWKLRSSYQVLNENEKLEAKDNPSDRATVSGEYKLANPTISYLVDGKTENVDANQPFTVTIGDSKEHYDRYSGRSPTAEGESGH